jgi:hypothetical protein
MSISDGRQPERPALLSRQYQRDIPSPGLDSTRSIAILSNCVRENREASCEQPDAMGLWRTSLCRLSVPSVIS